MSDTSMANEYRPRSLQEVLGQPHVVTVLTNLAKAKNLPPFVIIAGKFGCGKSTCARILAAIATCKHVDYTTATPCGTCQDCETAFQGDRDGANFMFINGGASGMKSLVDNDMTSFISAAPFGGSPRRVVLADEAQGMSKEARTTLLTLTENLPKSAMVIMTTTDVTAIDPALLSRAAKLFIAPFSVDDIVAAVVRHRPHLDNDADREALATLAPEADGSMRGMWNLLEIADAYEEPLTPELAAVIAGGATRADRNKLWKAVDDGNFKGILAGWKALTAKGANPDRLATQLADDLFARAAAAPNSRDWVSAIRSFSSAQVVKDEQAYLAALMGMATPGAAPVRTAPQASDTSGVPAQEASPLGPEALYALADSVGNRVREEIQQANAELGDQLVGLLARYGPQAPQEGGPDPLAVLREFSTLVEVPSAAEIAEHVVSRLGEHTAIHVFGELTSDKRETIQTALRDPHGSVVEESDGSLSRGIAEAAAGKGRVLPLDELPPEEAEAIAEAPAGKLLTFQPRVDLADSAAVYAYMFGDVTAGEEG